MRHTPLLRAGAAVLALAVSGSRPHREQQAPGAPPRPRTLEAAIVAIQAGQLTTPLVDEPAEGGGATVTFLAQASDGRAPRIVSDVTGWGERPDGTFDFTVGAMARVGASDWYALRATVAPRARVEYLIAYGETDYQLDPHNPRRVDAPLTSELVTPGYRPPPALTAPRVSPGGVLTEGRVDSRALGGPVGLAIYRPSGPRGREDTPIAVFHDLGASRQPQVTREIDWLVTRREIEPIVAVFVNPAVLREASLAAPRMRAFLAEELPAWLSSHHGLTTDAGRRAIIGMSFGAKDALDAALAPAGAFGRLGLLVPGRRIGPADIRTIDGRGARRLQVAILAGLYDDANVATARALRQALATAGHAVAYLEVPEGHNPRTWLGHLSFVLVALFGPDAASLP